MRKNVIMGGRIIPSRWLNSLDSKPMTWPSQNGDQDLQALVEPEVNLSLILRAGLTLISNVPRGTLGSSTPSWNLLTQRWLEDSPASDVEHSTYGPLAFIGSEL